MSEPRIRLRGQRRRLGLTLRDLSQKTDVSISHLSDLERGNNAPSLAVAHRLAVVLGLSVEDLFGLARVPAQAERTRGC